jgi:hypothetical protein
MNVRKIIKVVSAGLAIAGLVKTGIKISENKENLGSLKNKIITKFKNRKSDNVIEVTDPITSEEISSAIDVACSFASALAWLKLFIKTYKSDINVLKKQLSKSEESRFAAEWQLVRCLDTIHAYRTRDFDAELAKKGCTSEEFKDSLSHVLNEVKSEMKNKIERGEVY